MQLQSILAEQAGQLGVPGAAAGFCHGGHITYACHGITSTENPQPVDTHTLFQAGSIGKTFTATALARLEEQGRVDLDLPVRRYLPELRLKDAAAASDVTIVQLLNHSAGWDGDFFPDTGEGDDALAQFVARLDQVDQLTTPGSGFSYNNAAYSLAGRVIESVTGTSYERAVHELLLQPLGLRESFFFRDQVMTRRFVVGHRTQPIAPTRAELECYRGRFGIRGMRCDVAAGDGALCFSLQQNSQLLEQLRESAGESGPAPIHRLRAGMLPGHADRYVFLDGAVRGVTGYFIRGDDGRVVALHLFGRYLPHVPGHG